MSAANEAVGLVRDKGLDDGGAEMHVARGKAELQGNDRLESNVRTGIYGLSTYRADDIYILTRPVQSYEAGRRAEEGVKLRMKKYITG